MSGDPGDEWWDDVDGGGIRGWIPPDDRLWRHPSESGARSSGPAAPPPATVKSRGQSRSGPWIAGGATACVVLALMATGLAIMTAGSSEGDQGGSTPMASLTGEPTTEAGASRIPGAAAVDGAVSTAGPSLVGLRVTNGHGTSVGTGLVALSGGIVVTGSALVSRARTITVMEGTGAELPADVVGVDQQSQLAVLRIGDDLPAASFDPGDPATGSLAMAVAIAPGRRSGAPPTARVYAGTVLSAGRADGADPATGMFAVAVVDAPLSGDDIGCPLLDAAGHVSGMLERTVQSDGSTTAVFLPAELVLGVAQQLVTSGEVDHGWLGIQTTDAVSADPGSARTATTVALATNPTDGARIDSVAPGSPASTAGLQVGDVITGVGGYPVRSKAELDTRLYAEPPERPVELDVVQDGSQVPVTATLTDPDPDVPGANSSP